MARRRVKPAVIPGYYVHEPIESTQVSLSSDGRRILSSTSNLARAATSHDAAHALANGIPSSQLIEPSDDFTIAPMDDFCTQYEESGQVIVCEPPAKRSKNYDDPVNNFIPLRQEYLDEVLRLEGRGSSGTPATCRACQAPNPAFRCREDCMGGWLFCQACIVAHHQHNPLHWIEEWVELGYFRRTSLKALGLRVQLNHRPGDQCIRPLRADTDFTVIHTNGIHNVTVNFCHCEDDILSHRQQLLRNGWWPGSHLSPQTCATIACLRFFVKLNIASKVALYEYYKTLETLTDNTGNGGWLDKRRVLQNMVREFRHIEMLKMAGRGHVDDGVETTMAGALSVLCPACPRPGVNLPPDWQSAAVEESFKYILHLAQDANFRLANTNAGSLSRDPPLGDGWSYFVPRREYLDYLRDYVDEEDISTCSGFQALFSANTKRVLGLRATGVGAVICSRHNMFRPNGIGDLQKGERFANMTYMLGSSLRNNRVDKIIYTYDISCIFEKNLWTRNSSLPSHIRIKTDPANFALRVPNFHLPAHKPACHGPYSQHYTPGAGRTHGETIEQNWSILNKAAAQTKPMGPGTRQLTIEYTTGGHNHDRRLALQYLLPQRQTVAIKSYMSSHTEYIQLYEGLREKVPDMVEGWLRDEAEWQMDRSRPCPYEFRQQSHKTMKDVELELAKEELRATADGTAILQETTPGTFIHMAIELQHTQRTLSVEVKSQKDPTPSQSLDITKRRVALQKRIDIFRRKQRVLMPGLRSNLGAADRRTYEEGNPDEPECTRLFLPNELPDDAARAAVCFPGLAVVEDRMRESELRDTLYRLQRSLCTRTATNTFRNANSTGIGSATRARGAFDRIARRIHMDKIRYQYARNALLRLRGHGEWEQQLQPLADSDLRALNERVLTQEEQASRARGRNLAGVDLSADNMFAVASTVVNRGEGARRLAWIWYTIPQDGNLRDPVLDESLRVEFLKAKARRDRDREEIQLLEEEMRRTLVSYGAEEAEWRRLVHGRVDCSSQVREGLRGYALEHATTACERASFLQEKWGKIRAEARKALDHDFKQIRVPFDEGSQRQLEELEDIAAERDYQEDAEMDISEDDDVRV